MRSDYLFTSESVSEGHPDKVSDQISDAIVDLFLSIDPEARIACETLTTTQLVVLAGEIRGKGIYEDGEWAPGIPEKVEQTVRETVKRIGYEQSGFHWNELKFVNNLHGQSAHIAQGVDATGNKDEGAGDQGIMFGFACDETPDLMPAALDYSHKILQRMAADRKSGAAPFLEPDAKSQVTLKFEAGKPVAATAIVVSTQHKEGYAEKGDHANPELYAKLRDYVKAVVADVLPADLLGDTTVYHINPTGSFEIGGPDGDAGLTGRKIIVDTYGGAAPHGGGAFSGKDPTKVDRSAAYAARYLAKNIVAAGLARRCTIQLAYAIGVSEPLSLYVDTHGTGHIDDSAIELAIGRIERLGGLTPRGIRTCLGLNKPIYSPTAAYGHFGRKAEGELFPWEKTDLAEELKSALA
ncbi:MAG TPA: methionine adenosyltransferase [Sphingomicrobium sp.]|nr:methionine adenosyltransferase [Sphingomicrobium sp.]